METISRRKSNPQKKNGTKKSVGKWKHFMLILSQMPMKVSHVPEL